LIFDQRSKHLRPLLSSVAGACLSAAMLLTAHGAQAQVRSPYMGIGVGSTDYNTGIKLFGGAALTQQFGWEAQFLHFGNDRGPGFDASAWALGLSAVGYLPIQHNLSGFGKLGVHYVRGQTDILGNRFSDSSLELGLGIGALWQFTPQHAMRVEFENIGGNGGDVFSVGVQMKF
jgi:opacity protein-like surface antigen